jgi:hypothetical protein
MKSRDLVYEKMLLNRQETKIGELMKLNNNSASNLKEYQDYMEIIMKRKKIIEELIEKENLKNIRPNKETKAAAMKKSDIKAVVNSTQSKQCETRKVSIAKLLEGFKKIDCSTIDAYSIKLNQDLFPLFK